MTLKQVHVTCVMLSYAGFVLRGIWMMRGSILLRKRWVKVVPHVNDTILLASAAGLAIWSRQYPGQQAWLTAKVLALVLYIVLGSMALRPGKLSRSRRIAAWAAGQAVFFYIVCVALTRNPFVFA